ncbi:hypothetical protein Tco_0465750 [Tanacetum coccineum]
MLSLMFNPQEFFLPKELLPLKKRGRDRSSSSTSALPQAFEIGESSPLEAHAATRQNANNTNEHRRKKLLLRKKNSFAQPIVIEEAYKITWVEFKKLLIKKNCNLMSHNGAEDSKKMNRSIHWGIAQKYCRMLTASKPQTLEEAINIA